MTAAPHSPVAHNDRAADVPSSASTSEQPSAIPPESQTRRQVMRTVAIAGTVVAAGAGIAACGNSYNSGGSYGSGGSSSTSGTGSTSGQGNQPSSPGGSSGATLGSTADIPVGGGKIFDNQQVVVTQPAAGTFKGFSSICTHRGCHVDKVTSGLIECPCHGSKFGIADGSVQAGPAPRPLPAANVSVRDGQIILNS